MHMGFWWGNLKKSDNLQHLGVDGSIILTLLRPDGLLIKYPQFPDVLNALNVQPHNIFLLTIWHCRLTLILLMWRIG